MTAWPLQIEADQPTYISDPVNIRVFKRLLRTFLLKPLIPVCYGYFKYLPLEKVVYRR